MESLQMYHNPNCGTSRGILAHLRARGIEPSIVLYMNDPPSKETLLSLLAKMDEVRPAHAILRRREKLCGEMGLDGNDVSEETLIEAMANNPVLIQRPILIKGDRAILARQAEVVDDFLDEC